MMLHRAESATAYPLCWPQGWQRTPAHVRKDGRHFKTGRNYTGEGEQQRWIGRSQISFDRARSLLIAELDRLKARDIVLSTNVELRNDGQPRASAVGRRMDPGVAVYFTLKGRQMVMATDAYDSLPANLRSLGLAIEALRQLERHGGGTMMERAFAGFTALPAPDGEKPKRPWWTVMNYGPDPEARADLTADEIKARFNALAKKRHPDVTGGSADLFGELVTARDDAVRELGG